MKIPDQMRAMVLEEPGQPLKCLEVPVPQPDPEQVLIRVHACGVCRTDLHVVDGELPHPKLPLILGHEIVGTVVATGSAVRPETWRTRCVAAPPVGAMRACAPSSTSRWWVPQQIRRSTDVASPTR